MNDILIALWFFLPAAVANMAPVFAKKISFLDVLNKPLDFKKSVAGKRIFGDNKTFRGLATGYVAALLVLLLQVWLHNSYGFMSSSYDYSSMNIWLFSAIFTLGALGGDALESFFKRQLGKAPGKSWIPFDQIDWILGAVILSLPFTDFTPAIYLWAIFWGVVLHPISTIIGWIFGLKDNPI